MVLRLKSFSNELFHKLILVDHYSDEEWGWLTHHQHKHTLQWQFNRVSLRINSTNRITVQVMRVIRPIAMQKNGATEGNSGVVHGKALLSFSLYGQYLPLSDHLHLMAMHLLGRIQWTTIQMKLIPLTLLSENVLLMVLFRNIPQGKELIAIELVISRGSATL